MSGSVVILFSALALGVGGSFHCLGMCGPLVLSLPFAQFKKSTQLPAVLLYNLGRIMAYGFLGLFVFLFGKTLNLIGISQYLSIAIGILILLNLALPVLTKNHAPKWLAALRAWQLKSLGKIMGRKGLEWLPAAGFLNGLLPCGMVYLALGTAMATTAIFPAFYFMLLFGLGTLPFMVALPIIGIRISSGKRMSLKKITPVLSALVAVLLILRGLNLGIPYVSPEVQKQADSTTLKCCRK